MALAFDKRVRDPIHGLIPLTEQECGLIDSRPFQRLRRVRQLVMAYLVYPGALHTRFEHSLGTMHVAWRIVERLRAQQDTPVQIADEDLVVVRLAALLHDIGHGPFSHTSEEILDRLYVQSKVGPAASREKIHEKVTADIIRKVPEIAERLRDDQRDRVVRIIEGGGAQDFLRAIVSSSLDADKMDYLLRDAYYAGVNYGHFDLDRVIDSCRVKLDGSESYLMVDEDGLFAVEQLVLSKYHMTQQVYAHHVRVITDTMIVRGLELAVETDGALRAAFTYDGTREHLERYLELDDESVSASVLRCQDERARNVFGRLRDRRLYKEIARVNLNPTDIPDSLRRRRLSTLEPVGVHDLEAKVAAELQCEPWEVIVHRKQVKNPAYGDPSVLDPEAIYVLSRDGQSAQQLLERDDVVKAPRPADERLHIIAPWDQGLSISRDARAAERAHLAERIRRIILEA